jgi:hypothetical protein
MDGKNGELAKLQKKLQENPTPTESGPSVPSQRPPVATEVTKRPTEGKPFLDEAVMKEMLAKAPDEKAFDQKIINDQVNEQLAVYYDSKSSDAQRVTAKSKIDELYKIRDRREEIKKALYGTNPAVGKTVPAKETKRVTDNTQVESQPTIKLTSAVEKTVTSNPAPSPDTTVSPKLPGGMTEMAAIAKGKSLSDIGSIGVRNTTTAELGQTWKVKVDPKADMPEISKPVNPSEFQTRGTATGSFHGRFGGFAEPHPEGVTPSWSHYEKESDSKSADAPAEKISSKATSSKKEAAAKKAKSAGETKKKKLTKAEKEIEDRTHSDSMLGPVIPGTEADTRTEEEKIQGDAWEKAVGGVPEPEKNTEKQLTDGDLDKMMDDAAKQDVESAVAGNKARFEAMRQEWRTNRDLANKLESEYAQRYEKHVFEESKKFGGMLRGLFGIKPRLTPELTLSKEQADTARAEFNRTAKELMLFGGKRAERYRSRLSPKVAATLPYVMSKRLETQKKAANDAWGESKRLRPILEAMVKYKYALTGVSLGMAVISGVGVVPVLAAIGGGVLAGKGTKEFMDKTFVALARKRLGASVSGVRQNYFERSYDDLNQELEKRTFGVWAMEARADTASVAAGVAGGLAAGGYAYSQIAGADAVSVSGGLDSSTPHPHAPAGNPPGWEGATKTAPDVVVDGSVTPHPHAPSGTNPPPWEGSTTNTPNYVYGQSVGEGGMVSGPPPAEAGSIRLTDIPDPKLQGVPPDLRGVELPNEAPIPEPRPETMDAKFHTVAKGENAWNIMEGRGPDSAPVGGESDFLKKMDLPMSERQELLDQAVKHLEQNPELAKEIGAVKSDGNIHKIYPGEQINITRFDELLRQIYESNHPDLPETAPIPESAPEGPMSADAETADGTPLEEVEPHEPIETDVPGPDEFPEHGPVTVRGEVGTFVVEGRTADVNSMTIHDALNLYQGVRIDDQNALALLEEMSTDKESFSGVIEYMMTHGNAQPNDPSMTVGDYINKYKDMPYNPSTESAPATNDNVPDVTPYGFDQPTPNPDTVVREASVSGAETVGGQSLESYVRSVEQPKNGFLDNLFGLGKPNVAGTFEQMANLTIGDIKAMDVNGELPEGVSDTGFDVWSKEVANAAANDNDKTLAEYVSGLANSRAA